MSNEEVFFTQVMMDCAADKEIVALAESLSIEEFMEQMESRLGEAMKARHERNKEITQRVRSDKDMMSEIIQRAIQEH